jgi:ribonuclease Z
MTCSHNHPVSKPSGQNTPLEIHCIGVGEAFDPARGNTATIINSASRVLVDCGYAVPALLFPAYPSPEALDAIYLTHFHADHTFGLPGLLSRLHFDGRKKELAILGQRGTEQFVMSLLEMGYPGLAASFGYPIYFRESNEHLSFCEMGFEFALTDHPLTNYAAKVEIGGTKLAISGDGDLTESAKKLYQDCSLLVHEAFSCHTPCPGHISVEGLLNFANNLSELRTLVIVHLSRKENREKTIEFVNSVKRNNLEVIVANPGERIAVCPCT